VLTLPEKDRRKVISSLLRWSDRPGFNGLSSLLMLTDVDDPVCLSFGKKGYSGEPGPPLTLVGLPAGTGGHGAVAGSAADELYSVNARSGLRWSKRRGCQA